MNKTDICYLGAIEALELFRSRKLSPVELLEAQIERADIVEPVINAFSARRTDAARVAARQAEATYLKDPDQARPLEGLTTGLKNEHTLIGDSTTIGSSLLRGVVDTANAPITQRLLDAGAVIHARTNVPEFCCATFTRSREYGVTRNPWNPATTCGGSSGGSAASLAAGTSTLASGSDIGGSIRLPSSWCGVVGLKPSFGRVPEGVFAYAMNTYNHNGPLARSVADCALMFNTINGLHRDDPMSIGPSLKLPLHYGDLKGVKVAISVDLGFFDVHPDIVRNTLAVGDALRSRGATVEQVELRWDTRVRWAAATGLGFLMGRMMAKAIAGHRDLVNDYVLAAADHSAEITGEDYLEHFNVMEAMHAALQAVLDDHDVMICPTLAVIDTPAEGDIGPGDDTFASTMAYPFNMLSRHPVLNTPSGFAGNGTPTGVQIVGRALDDLRVFHVGANLEEALRWTRLRPQI